MVIGAGHCFKDMIGVMYEDVRLIETLRGGADGSLSMVPGHHA